MRLKLTASPQPEWLYLTYEGLKLGLNESIFWEESRLYLTYEGLKHF